MICWHCQSSGRCCLGTSRFRLEGVDRQDRQHDNCTQHGGVFSAALVIAVMGNAPSLLSVGLRAATVQFSIGKNSAGKTIVVINYGGPLPYVPVRRRIWGLRERYNTNTVTTSGRNVNSDEPYCPSDAMGCCSTYIDCDLGCLHPLSDSVLTSARHQIYWRVFACGWAANCAVRKE